MKLRIYSIVLLTILLSSCDEVEQPFPDSQGETSCPGVESPLFEGNQALNQDQLDATRRVLIMDFTGHRCAGCPAAALEANNIASDFPGEVFVLGVHPNIPSLTDPAASAEEPGDPFYTEWRTPEGSSYQDNYSIPDAIPLGVISGKEVSGNYFSQWASWRSLVEPLIEESRPAEINFEIEFEEETRTVQIPGNVTFINPSDDAHSIILAVVENNIEDWQKNGTTSSPSDPAYPAGEIPDYNHKHILRGHINGLGGTQLNTEPVVEGDVYSFCQRNIIDTAYNLEETSIYAILYNNTTLEVIDVLEHHIIE